MAPQSLAMPADIWVLHMNIVEKIKISKSFETPFFGLKRCLAVSMTYMHSDKTIFREKISRVASLSLVFIWNYFWFFVALSRYRHISLNSRIIIWLIDIRNLPNECGWNKQIKSESFRFKHLTIANLPNVEPTKKCKPLNCSGPATKNHPAGLRFSKWKTVLLIGSFIPPRLDYVTFSFEPIFEIQFSGWNTWPR